MQLHQHQFDEVVQDRSSQSDGPQIGGGGEEGGKQQCVVDVEGDGVDVEVVLLMW